MEGKYHIGLNGTPSPCHAKYFCPFGSESEHFPTKEEALIYSDTINEKRNNAIDIREGQPWFVNTNQDYERLKKRTIDNQPNVELERVKSHIQEELKYFDERLNEFEAHKSECVKWLQRYEDYQKRGASYWAKGESTGDYLYADPNEPVDPEVYKYLRDNAIVKPAEENYLKTHYGLFTRNIKRRLRGLKPVDYGGIENVFDDNVDLSKISNPDVIATNILLKEVGTNKVVDRINLSKEECVKMGVPAPGDNLLTSLSQIHVDSEGKKWHRNVRLKVSYSEQELFFKNKLREVQGEWKDYEFLQKRKVNYLRLINDIDNKLEGR